MIQRLAILGILKIKPSSGYDIKKFIEKELKVFSELETKSIYYPLKKMEEEGLVAKKEIKNAPLRKSVYYITPKGEREFFKLAQKTLLSQRRPFVEIDLPLYFLPFLDKKNVLALLRLRLRFLNRVREWLSKKEKELKDAPANIQLLIRHHLKLATAEKSFIKDMIRSVKDTQ